MHSRTSSTRNHDPKSFLVPHSGLPSPLETPSKRNFIEKPQHRRCQSNTSTNIPVLSDLKTQRTPLKVRGGVPREILAPAILKKQGLNIGEYSSNRVDNSNFASISRDDTYRSVKASQAGVKNQVLWTSKPSQYTKISFGESQTNFNEEMKKQEEKITKMATLNQEEEKKERLISIKKLLTNPHPLNKLNSINVRQPHDNRIEERPQTSAYYKKVGKGRLFDFECNENTWLNLSDDGSKDEKEGVSQTTLEEMSDRQSLKRRASISSKLLQSSRFIPNMKSLREGLLASVSKEGFFGKMMNFKEDKSQESSIRNDSKHSIVLSKAEDNTKGNNKAIENPKPRIGFRRRSDTSGYSGGECLKLTRHSYIVLAHEVKKMVIQKMPSSMNESRKEESKLLSKSKLKKPKDIHGNLSSPRDFVDDQHLETINSQTIKHDDPERRGSEIESNGLMVLREEIKQMDQVEVNKGNVEPLTLTKGEIDGQGQGKGGLETYWEMKSKTPEPGGYMKLRAAIDKAVENQTARNVRSKEMEFSRRIKQGDLKNALQIVFNINKKAEKTVFRERSAENIKTLRIMTKRTTRERSRGDEEGRDGGSSPYFKAINFRKDEVRAFHIAADQKKEIVITPLKKKEKLKKVKIVAKRSKSVPKVTALPVIEKAYL